MILVYSQHAIRSLNGRKGVKVLNPRFFTAAAVGAEAVYIVGSHPEIESAYRAVGVSVLPWTGGRLPSPLPPPPVALTRRRRRRKSDPAPSGN